MKTIKTITFAVLLLAGCSSGSGDPASGGGELADQPQNDDDAVGDNGDDTPELPQGEAGAANTPDDDTPDDDTPDDDTPDDDTPSDACSNVFIVADGTCDPDGEYAACDPDCFSTDVCANIRIAPDGMCDLASEYAPCDPDCYPDDAGQGGAGNDPDPVPPGEAGAANDPCANVFVIPDGECEGGPDFPYCDPDCKER
jgi:hypothetical protein